MFRNTAFLGFIALLLLFSCKTSQTNTSQKKQPLVPPLATLGGKPVASEEFEYVYSKNSPADSARTEKKIREYLDLFINFKLKVMDAESLGQDTSLAFKQELNGYRQQLAQPYLTEKSVTDALIRQAYDRMKEEIRAAHLLISVKPDADPDDTLKAYQKIKELRERAAKGEDFTALAKANSQDPTASQNGGDLGYFTALQMVYPFEEAAYNTPKGEISQPVRTRFGYHILKVQDRRPSQGKVTVAHIMINTNPEMPEEDAKRAKNKVDEIYTKLSAGANWDTLVKQFSQDASSNQNKGVLRAFGTSELGLPLFEETAFNLQKPGDISKPIQTPYGWHILKLVSKQGLLPFNEMEPSLKQRVSKDSRSELNKTVFIEKLKRENQFVENSSNLTLALSKADSSLTKGNWKYQTVDKNLTKTLFAIKNQKYSVQSFYDFAQKQQQARPDLKPAGYMVVLYKDYVKRSLLQYEEDHLAEKYPEYKNLLQEYRDGILFFQRIQDEVWTKSLTDSAGAEAFYNQNKENYRWGKRAKATIYDAQNQDIINQLKTILKNPLVSVDNPSSKVIYFDKNKEALSEDNKTLLNGLADMMKRDTSLVIEINAHADLKEPDGLSGKRSKVIADFLTSKNVRTKQLIVKDFGKFKPVSKTDRAKNSRAELNFFSTSNQAIEKYFNKDNALHLQIIEGTFQKGDNAYLDQLADWKTGIYNTERNGRPVMIYIEKVEEPRIKNLNESRGQVISDYQNYLEKIWIEKLRQRYPVILNDKEVQKVIQKLQK
jgi:peptidyl-prolyl cis-trans isomerase SurA